MKQHLKVHKDKTLTPQQLEFLAPRRKKKPVISPEDAASPAVQGSRGVVAESESNSPSGTVGAPGQSTGVPVSIWAAGTTGMSVADWAESQDSGNMVVDGSEEEEIVEEDDEEEEEAMDEDMEGSLEAEAEASIAETTEEGRAVEPEPEKPLKE